MEFWSILTAVFSRRCPGGASGVVARARLWVAGSIVVMCAGVSSVTATELALEQARAMVRADDERRMAVMERASASVVCIFDEDRTDGGSGVIITPDGYGLTNFHVIASMMRTRRGLGGMSDGKLYPLEVLGIDPTGDVAMFRLTGRDRFEPAPLGDSDEVAVGHRVFAMGNPFMMAEDFTPTVTDGIVSGVHRYQFGASGRHLVYTDCIQVDASINPGNSGGPLFNLRGEVIGINGRASFEQRGRVNVGVGYAISINQIKRFIPGLRAGLLTEHGSLGATVIDLGYRRVVFERMLEPSVASAAGIRVGDRLVRFAGREISSANQFANILGVYPAGWPVMVEFEQEDRTMARRVRLERLPVPTAGEFREDRALNRAETERVLSACHRALGDPSLGRGLAWKARRRVIDRPEAGFTAIHRRDAGATQAGRDGGATAAGLRGDVAAAQVEVQESAAGRGRRVLVDEDGRLLATYEYNGRTAEVVREDGERRDAGDHEADRVNLWMAARRALYAPLEEDRLERWRHRGGDEFEGRVVDLLEYVSDEGRDVRVAIDPGSDLPVRVMWKPEDAPSAARPAIEIELTDYRDVGGVLLPHRMEVHVGGQPVFVDEVMEYTLEDRP